jgi:class 3 adenylate cyclase/tetratricopeptide (TPR) repeat protein
VAVCTHCGRQNADDARFCSGCAAPLAAESAAPPAVRKTVTVVFCDMVDSTPLGERLDPESLRRVLAHWHESMRTSLERHGGTVEKFVGDAVMAVFGLPVAHEDDALRAVRAAEEMRVALGGLNAQLERDYGVEIQARTAVHTGDVVAGAGETLVTGDAVNVAARLEQNAKAGEILLGEQTVRLLGKAAIVAPLPDLMVKGKAQPVRAWRLTSVLPDVPAFARPAASPFVGRSRELDLLEAAFERVAAASRCEQVTILGPPGIGKSRVMREAVASLGVRARVVVGRCLPYGEGTTYWPLVEIVREIAGDEPRSQLVDLLKPGENAEPVADAVGAAVGAWERGGSPDETHWAIRTFLEALARDRPLVVVLEDLHWAEPRFLDLIEYVVGFSRERPILLLCSARPELLETRPSWATLADSGELLVLEPLAEQEVDTLVEALLEDRTFPEITRFRIVEAAEGNPLFIEQLLALQAEQGGAGGEFVVPPTLKSLLAARIDRLEPADRALIERAAVEGRRFHRGAVARLLSNGEHKDVGARLLALVRKQLIRPDRSDFSGDDAFRFAHMLIRDAAYDSTPKALRAQLHERYANWLEAKAGDRVHEYEELLGYHLEQACRYRRDLAPLDQEGIALGRRAAGWLASAGLRAPARGDGPAAAALLSRAVSLLPEGDPERLRLLPHLGEAVGMCGDFTGEIAVHDEAVERSEAAGDRVTRSYSLLFRGQARMQCEPEFEAKQAIDEAKEALRVFEELGDERGQARALQVLGDHHGVVGHHGDALEAYERAAIHAAAAGDERLEADARVHIGQSLFFGEVPLAEFLSYTEKIRALLGAKVRGRSLQALDGLAHAKLGRFETARELIADRIAAQESFGNTFVAEWSRGELGEVEMLAADPVAAERHLRRSYEALEEAGNTGFLSTRAAVLADVLYAQGRYEEAEQYTQISENASAPDDYASQILWRSARAKAIASQGRLDEGKQLAREAIALTQDTDNIDLRGDALIALAEVLRLADRPEEAATVGEQALRLYEQKGNVVSAGKARALLAEMRLPS